MTYKKTGNFIRLLRNEMGLTQEDLAEIFPVDVSSVKRWESGIRLPTEIHLKRLAEIFNVEVQEILSGERNAISADQIADDIVIDTQVYYSKQQDMNENGIQSVNESIQTAVQVQQAVEVNKDCKEEIRVEERIPVNKEAIEQITDQNLNVTETDESTSKIEPLVEEITESLCDDSQANLEKSDIKGFVFFWKAVAATILLAWAETKLGFFRGVDKAPLLCYPILIFFSVWCTLFCGREIFISKDDTVAYKRTTVVMVTSGVLALAWLVICILLGI